VNVEKIIQDLLGSSRPPDRILVLNNWEGPSNLEFTLPKSVDIISAPNTTCRGKFIAALFDPADYYLLLDDDTSVSPGTLEALLRYATRTTCTGYLGCWLDPNTKSVNSGNRLWPHEALIETRCDTFCGCAMFMSFSSLVRMLMLEERVRLGDSKWKFDGDDILAGLANRSTIIPLSASERFVDLGYQGQAMCYAHEDYYGMRDRFTLDVVEALGRGALPDWEA
jgi:hypothetical protein